MGTRSDVFIAAVAWGPPDMKFRILYDVRYANGYVELEAGSEEAALKIFDKIPDHVLRENTDDTHVEIETIKEIK